MNDQSAAKEVPAPAPKKKIWLEMAPLQLPQALCSDCGNRMTSVPVRDKKGRVDQNRVELYCDTCECGFEAALVYFNGQNIKYKSFQARSVSA